MFLALRFCGSDLRPLRLSQVGQLDCNVLYQSPGRHSLSSTVSVHPPPSLLVSSEEDYSVCLPHSRRTESCRGLSFQGKLPSIRMVSSTLGFSADHSGQSSSSGGPPRLLPQSSSTLLCEDLRPERWGSGRVLHPVVGLPRVCVPSILPHPESSSEGFPRPDGPLGGTVLAQETLVSSPPVSSFRSSEIPSVFPRLLQQPISRFPHPDPSSLHLTLWPLSRRQAILSVRAADLASRYLRVSSHSTYDSRLVPYFEWCHHLSIDPHHAPLACIADFLISLFDKNKSLSTIKGYRSVIDSIH